MSTLDTTAAGADIRRELEQLIERAVSAPADARIALVGALRSAELRLELSLRADVNGSGDKSGPDGDQLLDVRETARRLGCSADWIYHHSSELPFAVRLGPRQLRFSARGIERYIKGRRAT